MPATEIGLFRNEVGRLPIGRTWAGVAAPDCDCSIDGVYGIRKIIPVSTPAWAAAASPSHGGQ
jgi:hypothetical protein